MGHGTYLPRRVLTDGLVDRVAVDYHQREAWAAWESRPRQTRAALTLRLPHEQRLR